MTKILFVTSAGRGHINPLIPLARAASAAGDQVMFATPDEALPTVAAFGFPAVPVPSGDPLELSRAWANLPADGVNGYVVAEIFTRIQGLAALPALRAAMETFRPDLVISSDLAPHVAADAHGVASAYLGISALDLADLDWARISQASNDLRTAAGLPPSRRLPYETSAGYLSPVPPLLWNDPTRLPAGWIWYRHEDAEGLSDAPVAAGGPRPRIYATLGSVAGSNSFGRPLFNVMLHTLGELDADVLFTVGPFDQSQLGPPPANVTVSAYEPQARALICDTAVIHAGAGTTVAALARGLPLVAVPMFADQMHNTDRLVAHRVGIRVDPDHLAAALPPAIDQVLRDPTYRRNAQTVAAAIAERPTPAEAVKLLKQAL